MAQIVRRAQPGIRIVRRVSPVLAAVVPPGELDGFNAVLGTIFPVLDQLLVGKEQTILR